MTRICSETLELVFSVTYLWEGVRQGLVEFEAVKNLAVTVEGIVPNQVFSHLQVLILLVDVAELHGWYKERGQISLGRK